MGDKWQAVIFRGLIKTSKIIRFDNFGKVTFLCTPFKVSYCKIFYTYMKTLLFGILGAAGSSSVLTSVSSPIVLND